MMSPTANLLVLLCVTAGICDKTTNINLCCPKDQAHVKSEINEETLVRASCTPLGLTDMEWEERVSQIKWNLEELNSTGINFSSSADELYKCSKPEVMLEPLDFLVPGITERR